MKSQFTYEGALKASERIHWTVEDLIGGDKTLNFDLPFLPESLARTQAMTALTPREQMLLNQIRGHGYLYTFGLVEEFILPFVLDHARPHLEEDDHRTRALLAFAAEEAKHIHLFKRFREEFLNGFGHHIDVIGPARDVAAAVLGHHPLAVALAILHIEWMTQRHYVESVRDDQDLDPQFKSLLKHHWMEESQHAQLDTLMVEALAENLSHEEREQAVGEYLEIGMFLDGGIKQQGEFDLDAFERAAGRTLEGEARRAFLEHQHQALRWTFLGTGMTHPQFLAALERLHPDFRAKIESVAPAFC